MTALLRPRLALAALAVGALGLAACGDDSGSSSASTAAAGTTAASAATTAASAGTTAASAATTGAASETATVSEADNASIGQKILVNEAGMTVYLFVPDASSKTSTVPAGIKANWPAVVAEGTPVAGEGVDATKLTVEAQPDGTQQVAYNGHLLYTFISDTAPGQATGQGLGGAWYVLTPAGEEIDSD